MTHAFHKVVVGFSEKLDELMRTHADTSSIPEKTIHDLKEISKYLDRIDHIDDAIDPEMHKCMERIGSKCEMMHLLLEIYNKLRKLI